MVTGRILRVQNCTQASYVSLTELRDKGHCECLTIVLIIVLWMFRAPLRALQAISLICWTPESNLDS